jgi:3-methylcrotonyl-CoA carboxylase alpha subunit
MISKLLVANRGEIARRILRTCREQGVETVAVYSTVDADLPHVTEADEAVCLGPARAAESYLNTDKLLQAARETGAQAIHPGYGFLSENADFVEACHDAGLVFVGPSAESIRLMGDKAEARRRMADSGVPVLPGLDEPAADDDALRTAAGDIGFPLLIKAVAGGGGKGMRIVHAAGAFDEELAAARREARGAFGDDRVLLERYLPAARHVEVQVFADRQGNTVHLYERDCSVQRRHQKVIEEAPAPGLTPELREQMGAAAVRAAEAIGYEGAGTVEFLLAPDGHFYFMEMNTRLQVEHPVTEMITGQDLVAWQLWVASGEPLPMAQEAIPLKGAAMEVRVYAEDPAQGFLPSAGTLAHADWPRGLARVDTGFETGHEVSDQYDPMVAKIIAGGPDRDSARQRLCRALRRTRLSGIRHNLDFLLRVLESEPFAAARLDTRLLEYETGLTEVDSPDPGLLLAAAAADEYAQRASKATDPWSALTGWRGLGRRRFTLRLGLDSAVHLVSRIDDAHGVRLEIDGRIHDLGTGDRGGLTRLWLDDAVLDYTSARDDQRRLIFIEGRPWPVVVNPSLEQRENTDAAGQPFVAPMSGTVVACHVQPGTRVAMDEPVITLEAMKMETTLRAPAAGTVTALPHGEGDTVREGEILADFEADATSEDGATA